MTKMRRFQLGIFHEPMSIIGRLVKLADTPDLGSGAERRRGSTPRAATFLSFGRQALKHRGTGGGVHRGLCCLDTKKALFLKEKQGFCVVGVKGFEPSTLWSQTRCASQAALHPEPMLSSLTRSNHTSP